MFEVSVGSSVHAFSVFVALTKGFSGEGELDAADIAQRWLGVTNDFAEWVASRLEAGEHYLTGVVLPAVGVFGWKEGDGSVVIKEPNVVINVSTQPELHGDLREVQILEIVQSLATFMGERHGQMRIYVRQPSRMERLRIYQEEGSVTPTQENPQD